MTVGSWDVVVIGGGAAGLSAAQTVAAAGRRVALVEAGRLGGECTWNGCVPSKSLIEAARIAHDVRRGSRFGIVAGEVRVDFTAVMDRVREVVTTIARFEDVEHLDRAGISVLAERARIVDRATLEVGGARVSCGAIVVATGSRPAVPAIDGLAAVPFLTNETLFDLREQPRRMLVLGGGPIGLEMAQAFRRLGSEVVVVDVLEALLPREDADVSSLAHRLLEAEGIRFELGATVERVAWDSGSHRLSLRRQDQAFTLEGDALLVATGRASNTAGLGLEEAGVRVGQTGIAVDAHLRTTVEGIWAAGDVTGMYPFTHVAAYQGRVAAQNALGKRHRADYRVCPWVTFTDPEIAHLGWTEAEARRLHGDVRVATLPFTAIDRAVIQGETDGLVKVVTRGKPLLGHAGGGELLGAHLIGPGAGELLHEFVVAMQARVFAGRLAQAIHAYPTMAMGAQQAVAQLFAAGRAVAGDLREELAGSG